ncbi:MAG: elongation factor P [Anaerolineae bacterium]|nr:elongation factor P [Anaerolineae bacterium]
MIDVNQLRRGASFTVDNQIYKVLNYQHIKPGRGNATIRVKVRDLRSGTTTDMTFNSGTAVQDIEVDRRRAQFLYDDGQFLTFMDMETYEQPQIRKELFGDDLLYLKENMELRLSSYEGEYIDYELPQSADYQVTEAEPAVAGDTATAAFKKVKLETGLVVQTPLFVVIGDTIRVNTEDGSYITRV